MREGLKDFASGLREILNRMNTPGLRPFACDGSPLSCNVFLVGSNPATPMYRSFWEFWSDDFGFDKASFMQAYREARTERGELRTSKTRHTLEWVVDASAPTRCLETNVYAKPTSGGVRNLGPEDLNSEPLRYLLDWIKPGLIIGHGRTARRHLEQQNLNCRSEICISFFVANLVWHFYDGYTP